LLITPAVLIISVDFLLTTIIVPLLFGTLIVISLSFGLLITSLLILAGLSLLFRSPIILILAGLFLLFCSPVILILAILLIVRALAFLSRLLFSFLISFNAFALTVAVIFGTISLTKSQVSRSN
jgi:hypothetical protein